MARGITRARRRPGRHASLVAILGALAALGALGLGPGAASAAACANARAHPGDVSLTQMRKAITCLVNQARKQRDRRPLERSRRLKAAAKQHNEVMLATDCLRHRCEGERGLSGRVRASGYTKGRKAWRVAEVLGYENTPRQMIGRWMNSGINRHRILKSEFRDVGVGVGWGAPVAGQDDSRFATYTIVFGWRRP